MPYPKFIAYVKGSSACDYSYIGCGETVWSLKAQTFEEALEEVRLYVVGDGTDNLTGYYEQRIGEVVIYELLSNPVEISTENWYKNAELARKQTEIEAMDKKEREIYLKLKAKYDPD